MNEVEEAAVLETELNALGDSPTARQIMDVIAGFSDNAINIALKRTSGGGSSGGSGGWVGPFVYRAIDTIYVSVTADGGTFTLTVNGETTSPISWDADLATMLAAIIALPSVTASDVGFDAGPGNIGFALGFLNEAVTADATGLTGVGHDVTISLSDRAVALHEMAEGDILTNAACFRIVEFDDSASSGNPKALLADTPAADDYITAGWDLKDISGTSRLYSPGGLARRRAGALEVSLDDDAPGGWIVVLPTVALQAVTLYLVISGCTGDGTEGEIHVYLNVSTPTGGTT